MTKFFRRHKKGFFAGIAAVCLLAAGLSVANVINPTGLKSAVGYVLSPLQKGVGSAADWVSGKVSSLAHLGSMEAENERLKAENEELRIENSRLREVDKENERLSALVEIDRRYITYPKTAARLIAHDSGNWFNSFTIDKGSRDGIAVNMVVLGNSGLIGRVIEVGYNYARVISLIDDASSISVRDSRTDDAGILKGDTRLMLEGKCRMEFIDADAQMAVGDEIVTSQYSDIYPAGVAIGAITQINLSGNGTKEAIIKPDMDFKHISAVLVITELFGSELSED